MVNRAGRRRLGKLGKKKDLIDASFDYFDHEIRVHPRMTNLAILGFMDVAKEVDTDNELGSMEAIRDFLHSCIHPDDWDEFWKVSLQERQSLEDFMTLQWRLMELVNESESDRPFTHPSDSSDGQGTIDERSKGDSFSRVMERFEGRPDLRSMTMTARDRMMAAEAASTN